MNRKLARVAKEAEGIVSELGKRKRITVKQSADYLARISRICLDASRHYDADGREHYIAHKILVALSEVEARLPENSEFSKIAGSGHGILDTVRHIPFLKMPVDRAKWFLAYNALHWAGISEYFGAKNPLGTNVELPLKSGTLRVDSEGKINLDAKSLRQLVLQTPHFLKYDFSKLIKVKVSGKGKFSPLQLFGVLRSASNSLHSVKLNTSFYQVRKALEDGAALRRSLEELSNPAQIRKELSGGRSSKYADDFLNGPAPDSDNFLFESVVHPSLNELVRKRLSLGRRITSKEIIGRRAVRDKAVQKVVLHAANLAYTVPFLWNSWGFHSKNIRPLINRAHEGNSVSLRILPDSVEIEDAGLGRTYVKLSRQRDKSGMHLGTSTPLQERAFDISRRVLPRGAITTLRSKTA